MWILAGETSEEDGEASVGRVSGLIEENGGKVTHAEFWGRRTLAYPIDGTVEGAYYLTRFSTEPDTLIGVERALSADQAVIRYLLTRFAIPDGAKVTPQSMDTGPPERVRRGGPGGGPGRRPQQSSRR